MKVFNHNLSVTNYLIMTCPSIHVLSFFEFGPGLILNLTSSLEFEFNGVDSLSSHVI